MAVNRTSGRTLARLNLVGYLLLAFGGSLAAAPALAYLKLYFLEPIADLAAPGPVVTLALLWILLVVSALVAVTRVLASERPSFLFSGITYLAFSLLLLVRLSGSVALGHPVETSLSTSREHLQDLRKHLVELIRSEGLLPEDLASDLPSPRRSPYSARGRNLDYQVVVENGFGPRLAGRDGDLAGTIYCVVDPRRRLFWLSAIVLDGSPTGRLLFLPDSKNEPCVLDQNKRSTCYP